MSQAAPEARAAVGLPPPAATSAASTAPTGRSAGTVWTLTGRAARLGLGLLALLAMLVQGGVFIQKTWLWSGDTIYHRALMAEILNGELLPGGPYAGLPAFYSPLFHYLAAGLAAVFRFDPLDGVKLLSILAAPCMPLVAYYLARVLGFDRAVALLGAVLATFGGGLKLTEERVWVDALFTGQHNFFPLFPRDAAFLLLPLGLAWVYRGLIDDWRAGAWLAGVAFGLMILVHTQTAVFAAPIISLYLTLLLSMRRDLVRRALQTSAITALVALALSAFWWVSMLAAIVRGGEFRVEMPAYRVPVKLRLEEAPLDFGIFLPLGLIGLILTAGLLLRRRSPAALLLLVWWAAPVALAIVRPTDFPGGDTFFPRRLWQFASQPLAVMAAFALLSVLRWGDRRAGRAVGRESRRPNFPSAFLPTAFGGAILAVALALASVPNSWGTWQRIGVFWNEPTFADTEWDLGSTFRYGSWLAERGRAEGPRTVLVPMPDATMVWYLAGQKVVYLYPTAAIKLAFSVDRLTGYGTTEREADLIAAFSGQPDRMAELTRKYGAAYVVLRRDGDRLGAVDLPATALRSGRNRPKMTETNHYEWLTLGEGDTTRFQFSSPVEGTATVTLRARRRSNAPRISNTLVVNGVDFPITEAETPRDEYAEITRAVAVRAGANDVQLRTAATMELARFVAYTTPLSLLEGSFRLAYEDPYTVVLSPR